LCAERRGVLDPVVTELIRSIGTDALQILGPAVVAALAAYKAASLQFKATLQQLRESNEFSARQHLFDYYKGRQKRLSESHASLMSSLGSVLGANAAAGDGEPDGALQAIVDTFTSMAKLHLGAAPFEIQLVLRDMKAKRLGQLEEYRELEQKAALLIGLDVGPAFESKRAVVFTLIEAYGALERCNQLLLEQEMDALFSKYVGARA
jgi:hypothetical protein